MPPRNGYVRVERLHDLFGRINYITSPDRQEHLFATYKTANMRFWKILKAECQQEFKFLNHRGKCVEAKEIVITLPELFLDFDSKKILKEVTEAFKRRYNVECISGMHHNKTETNLHIHLIFAERQLLPEVKYTYAEKVKYYDESGKSCTTKKQISDENHQIRPGCQIIRKGDLLKRNLMSPKDPRLQAPHFPDELRHMYVDLINSYIDDPEKQLHMYDSKGPYLPTKKYGKENPKEKEIKSINDIVKEWNHTVDLALDSNISYETLCQIKQEEITAKVATSYEKYGKSPERYPSIVSSAINFLKEVIRKISHFLHLHNVMNEISKKQAEIKHLQSTIIPSLHRKMNDLSGILQIKKKKSIDAQINKTYLQIKETENSISDMLSQNGYANMQSFENDYSIAKEYYLCYTNYEDQYSKEQVTDCELQKADTSQSIEQLINNARSLQIQNKTKSKSSQKKVQDLER